jgi:hypothetical protein
MHHTREGDDARCVMRSGCGHVDAALLSLAGGTGVLPHFITAAFYPEPSAFVDAFTASEIARAERPDSPPPRA